MFSLFDDYSNLLYRNARFFDEFFDDPCEFCCYRKKKSQKKCSCEEEKKSVEEPKSSKKVEEPKKEEPKKPEEEPITFKGSKSSLDSFMKMMFKDEDECLEEEEKIQKKPEAPKKSEEPKKEEPKTPKKLEDEVELKIISDTPTHKEYEYKSPNTYYKYTFKKF